MKRRLVIACAVFAIGLAGLTVGCASSNDKKGAQGSLTLRMGATADPIAGAVQTPAGGNIDDLSHLKAAVITISGIEARLADGTWVPVDTGLPAEVDLVAIMHAGNAATLPADLLPEGDYDALALRITAVLLTLPDETKVPIAPPGTGWTVLVPANFSVVAGQSTIVNLRMSLLSSFKFFDGEFGFEPEFEVVGVEHD